MEVVVNGVVVEVDDRHMTNSLMWVLRYIAGPQRDLVPETCDEEEPDRQRPGQQLDE